MQKLGGQKTVSEMSSVLGAHSDTVTTSQHPCLSTVSLCKTGLINSQSQIGEGLIGLYHPLINCGLLMDSGEQAAIIFTCVPIEESTRLQWIVPSSQSHRRSQLNSMDVERDLCSAVGGRETRGCGKDYSDQNVCYIGKKLSKTNSINSYENR